MIILTGEGQLWYRLLFTSLVTPLGRELNPTKGADQQDGNPCITLYTKENKSMLKYPLIEVDTEFNVQFYSIL